MHLKTESNRSEDKGMAQGKTSKKILFVVGAVLCCLFAFMLAVNLTIIIKGVINPATPPSVFGVTPMVVQSGSMSGNAEDHIEVGDLIFTVKPDVTALKKGDIISYMEGDIAVTRRIIDIQTDADGKLCFITKGDANNVEDPAVSADAVFGLYKGRIAGLGDFALFLQKPLGMAVFIGIPVCAFILYDIVRRQRSTGRADRENAELRAEIEKLRAEAEKKSGEQN